MFKYLSTNKHKSKTQIDTNVQSKKGELAINPSSNRPFKTSVAFQGECIQDYN